MKTNIIYNQDCLETMKAMSPVTGTQEARGTPGVGGGIGVTEGRPFHQRAWTRDWLLHLA